MHRKRFRLLVASAIAVALLAAVWLFVTSLEYQYLSSAYDMICRTGDAQATLDHHGMLREQRVDYARMRQPYYAMPADAVELRRYSVTGLLCFYVAFDDDGQVLEAYPAFE